MTDNELAIIEDLLDKPPKNRPGLNTTYELFTQSPNRAILRT